MKPCIRCNTSGTENGVCLQTTPHGNVCPSCLSIIVKNWVDNKDVGRWA